MADVARRPKKARPGVARADGEATAAPKGDRDGAADAAELRLARRVASLAPLVTLGAAGVVGATVAFGPALLVLAGGALFGTVAFFWASLRTLGGDAPLAEGFDSMSRRRIESPDGAQERKRSALRALKDLELEHSIGKIDDQDFAELSSHYRAEAKAILKEIDTDIGPRRARAEQIARGYLEKRGVSVASAGRELPEETAPSSAEVIVPAASGGHLDCVSCHVHNEPDATFCKKCGVRLSPKACPACGVVNEADAVFCKKCGRGLEAPAEEKSDVSA